MCEVQAIMEKNEEYARGWVKLFEKRYPAEAIHMAQYALDVQKLRHKHEGICERCKKVA